MIITINGRDVRCQTAPDVTIRVGAETVDDSGDASYCTITLYDWDGVPAVVGDQVQIVAEGTVRFVGTVADVSFEHEAPGLGRVDVTAMGPLTRFGQVTVGDTPWPAETAFARAHRIADLVGVPLVVQGGQMEVWSRDVDRKPARDLLDDLADDMAGRLFDHAGTVYLQAFDARRELAPWIRWMDHGPETWTDMVGTWRDQQRLAPNVNPPLVLPCDAVAWQPTWALTSGNIVNQVTVVYGDPAGDPRPSLTLTDQDSIDRWGRVETTITTRLVDSGDATSQAGLALTRWASPQWSLTGITVYPHLLDPQTRADLYQVKPGQRVDLTGLPQPAPAAGYQGVVEGWTETVNTITLHLSDVRHSYAVVTWEAVPPTVTWQAVPPSLVWGDAIDRDRFEEAA